MITQTFDLNLIPEQAPVVVHCDQYDKGTGRLIVKLYEGDVAYSPSGTAIIQGRKPDGHGFAYSATLSGNTVTADLTEQMSAVSGHVRCQIVVTETTGRTGTFAFILDVQKSALPDDTELSDSDYQLIEQGIQAAQDAEESAEDAEAWAVGERGGVPVGPTDPTYHNNSKYWSDQAAAIGDLDDLNDVTISSATNGQVLTYDSNDSEWKNASLPTPDIDDLGDVNISSLSNGQVLKYNSTSSKWENANESGGGASDLDDLSDVSISSPTNGQVLKYNSTSQEWENANESGGGGDYVGLYGMTEIQSSDGQGTTALDLDTYTTVGNYYCNAKAKISLMTYQSDNLQTSGSGAGFTYINAIFVLTVKRLPNNNVTQEITIVADSSSEPYYRRYIRYYGTGGWTFWSRQGSNTGYSVSLVLNNLTNVTVPSPSNGDALVYQTSNTRWVNKPINKVTSFAVDLTGWTSDTTSQSGTTLYKKQISLNHVYVESPTVDIGSSGVLPTVAEQESYNLLQYVTVDDAVPCLYLYASAIPTTAFYIKVRGCD